MTAIKTMLIMTATLAPGSSGKREIGDDAAGE